MTREEKELLLKDLCARLPYKVKASYYGAEEECECFDTIDSIYWVVKDRYEVVIGQYDLPIEKVKPYLFPLSEMTDKQYKEMQEFVGDYAKVFRKTMGKDCALELWLDADECDATIYLEHIFDLQNWLNKNHFDYRGLIKKRLAIDATGLNIYD